MKRPAWPLAAALLLAATLVIWLRTNRGPRYLVDACAAPKLVPALTRLEQCSPNLYAFVASQSAHFVCSSEIAPIAGYDSIVLSMGPSGLDQFQKADEYSVMRTAVLGSRMLWQKRQQPKWAEQQRRADIMAFEQRIVRECPPPTN